MLLEIEMVEEMVSLQSFGDENWHLIRWMNELMSEFYKTFNKPISEWMNKPKHVCTYK